LAPVAGLDLQSLGKTPLQAAQGGGVSVSHSGSNEFVEQAQRVV
jgi:hypothetical protein